MGSWAQGQTPSVTAPQGQQPGLEQSAAAVGVVAVVVAVVVVVVVVVVHEIVAVVRPPWIHS